VNPLNHTFDFAQCRLRTPFDFAQARQRNTKKITDLWEKMPSRNDRIRFVLSARHRDDKKRLRPAIEAFIVSDAKSLDIILTNSNI
jgi:hypothetical protein